MLSKEEIEKSKERCNSIVKFCKDNKECQENKVCSDCYIEIEDISAIEILLQYIKQLENQIQAKEMEHKYDVNMIDEVKGNSVKLYKEIRKQNKIIDEMAYQLSELTILDIKKAEYITLGNKEEVKQYFEKKVEGK